MKKILVIGATSAIAQHCARIWASKGNKLFLVSRNEDKIKTIAADLKVRGAADVTTYSTDLNNIEDHNKFIDTADLKLNGIDIALIAHGTLSNQKSCQKSVAETLSELHTNAISTISLLTIIANRFEAKKEGIICVISSVAGDRGRASNYVYGSAKAMITAFTSGLRQRLYKSNVAIITIKPGYVDTPMTSNFKKGLLWIKPHEVASKIVKAIDRKKSEVYIPVFWWFIMKLIRAIPSGLFKRLKI